jgi:hypothetical protein
LQHFVMTHAVTGGSRQVTAALNFIVVSTVHFRYKTLCSEQAEEEERTQFPCSNTAGTADINIRGAAKKFPD